MALKTPLYSAHVALKARMVEFGGWDMPVQYDSVLAEHNAVRNSVGLFDTSHMSLFAVEGSNSLDALSRVVTQDLRTLAIGACRYGFMLDESGGVIDDLIVYRMGEESWLPVANAGTAQSNFAWLKQHCEIPGSTVRYLRDEMAKIDLQGPADITTLKGVLNINATTLRRFRWVKVTASGHEWLISRTGYTGEDGIEIYASHEAIASAWNAFVEAGVKPCGLGARDTLRLEAGFPLYGHELDLTHSPAEAGLMRYARKEEPFIGRDVLLQRAVSPELLLAPFLMKGRQTARHNQPVLNAAHETIGLVTSGTYAPTVGRAIGFAYLNPTAAVAGTPLFIDNGRTHLPAVVTTLPFLNQQEK